MQVIIEGAEVDIPLPDREVTLKQLVDEVETFLLEVGKVPVALNIDGVELSQEELLDRELEKLTGSEVLKFGVVSVLEFLRDNLEGAAAANGQLIEHIRTFSQEVGAAQPPSNGEELVNELSHFCDFWFRLSQLLPDEFSVLQFDGKLFAQFFESLTKLFEEIVDAIEQQDLVLAADLMMYEVLPAVEALDKAIPTISIKLTERAAKDEAQAGAGKGT